jgi:hypothetical protein
LEKTAPINPDAAVNVESGQPTEPADEVPLPKLVDSLPVDFLSGDTAPPGTLDSVPMPIDDAKVAAAGIRKLSSKHLTLYTDLPPSEEIEQLPAIFDQAFPQWCDYFQTDPAEHPQWSMIGFLMKDKARFQQAGLLPESLPPFEHGFSYDYMLWLYDQPSDYYRRHLLLHEGTHGWMNTILGNCGPPWYMEGIAELLATHRWHNGRLSLCHMPADRHEARRWGRIRLIKDATAQGRSLSLEEVIQYPSHVESETEPYAWCWAAARLLDKHPRYRDRFHQLQRLVRQPDFTERFRQLMGEDWDELCEEWQLFVNSLEYGHDVGRTAIDFTPGQPLPPTGATATIAADRGWQNSGQELRAGTTYRLRATGRYQVADRPQVWWCEPNGVSIRYHKGRALGILLAAVRSAHKPNGSPVAWRPVVVGLEATLTSEETGTLYLKINDSAAELSDNAGELTVEIQPLGTASAVGPGE